jgi:hypothetical protein
MDLQEGRREVILTRAEVPGHVSSIPELDLSADVLAERVERPWFRLGVHTARRPRDEHGVEEVISRQTVLLEPNGFGRVFERLEAVGNVVSQLGQPYVNLAGESRGGPCYVPFYRFEWPFTSVSGEPLVFLRNDIHGHSLFINPDLWMFLELEDATQKGDVWRDARKGTDVIVRREIDGGRLNSVDVRTDYLLKYLRARQMSMVVAHFRELLLYSPPRSAVDGFVKEDETIGSASLGTKAIFQNWGYRTDCGPREPFLQRRLHLWFEVRPPDFDPDDPWDEKPSFDPFAFTLPTAAGPVTPARWKHSSKRQGRDFEGVACDFGTSIYFRQEVLKKYEESSGFFVGDDGSVRCRHFWGLDRSTSRIGNELLCTWIGDFAEGVPYDEWPHWQQYAVDAPDVRVEGRLREEPLIPESVNSVVKALENLSETLSTLGVATGSPEFGPAWRGSLDSLAARQMKWVYPAGAGDDEFLKRATLTSTLVLDGLQPTTIRAVLRTFGAKLHQKSEAGGESLGSRKLLQRLALVSRIITHLSPKIGEIPALVLTAEAKKIDTSSDLASELAAHAHEVQKEFAPLAFLYDLRTAGGLAHSPNKESVSNAVSNLGLAKESWHRIDYLALLKQVTDSLCRIGDLFETAALTIRYNRK